MRRPLTALLAGLWLAACSPGTPPLPQGASGGAPAEPGPPLHEVRVVSNGWHAVIAVRREAVAATGLLPEAARYPEAEFLEFGWGDRTYFPAPDKSLGMTLEAALVPTDAVLHLAGLPAPPERLRPDDEVVTLRLGEAGFRALVGAVSAYVERPAPGVAAEPLSEGLRPGSDFYAAKGRFYLLNTCNTWTARVLRAAGLPVEPAGVVTADDLMERLREALPKAGRPDRLAVFRHSRGRANPEDAASAGAGGSAPAAPFSGPSLSRG